jgi:hypothetical protein
MRFSNASLIRVLMTVIALASSCVTPVPHKRSPEEQALLETRTVVEGALHLSDIRAVLDAHTEETQSCFESTTEAVQNVRPVVVIWRVRGDGTVEHVEPMIEALEKNSVYLCLASAVLMWTFPKPTNGGVVWISRPFVRKKAT